jgi:hypothetical protein
MWLFESGTGRFLLDSATGVEHLATGYSGISNHKNNPLSQHLAGLGPIPIGQYSIGEAGHSERSGPLTMHLVPQPGPTPTGAQRSRFTATARTTREPPRTAASSCPPRCAPKSLIPATGCFAW